jgi:hypothetical protein
MSEKTAESDDETINEETKENNEPTSKSEIKEKNDSTSESEQNTDNKEVENSITEDIDITGDSNNVSTTQSEDESKQSNEKMPVEIEEAKDLIDGAKDTPDNEQKVTLLDQDIDDSRVADNNSNIPEIKSEDEQLPISSDSETEEDEKIREMLVDFADLEDFDMEDLMEIQNAIEEVKKEEENLIKSDFNEVGGTAEISSSVQIPEIASDAEDAVLTQLQGEEISDELTKKIEEELEKRRQVKKVVTEEMFQQYCTERRTKIWYHALWYLVFDVEDHKASKSALHEILKEVTSKSAIDPLPEHKFYFGLSFILRLSINDQKVIDFRGDTLKLNIGYDLLIDLLSNIGPPISERPVITQEKRKEMFSDFLNDDFNDI